MIVSAARNNYVGGCGGNVFRKERGYRYKQQGQNIYNFGGY
jgi:hypothetical protein